MGDGGRVGRMGEDGVIGQQDGIEAVWAVDGDGGVADDDVLAVVGDVAFVDGNVAGEGGGAKLRAES